MSTPSPRRWQGVSHGPEQTAALGAAIGRLARAGDLIALRGELGAGKTQLVRGLAEGLGVDPTAVASPTFVIVHEYPSPSGGPALVHIDAYRIRTLEDLESIGWDVSGQSEWRPESVVAVEWADRLGEALGPEALEVALEHAGEGHRRVSVTVPAAWGDRAGELGGALARILAP